MKDDKIIKIADVTQECFPCTVKDLLDSALKVIEEEPRFSKKAVIILIDDSGNNFITSRMAAGIAKTSDIVKALDIAHHREMKELESLGE